MRLPSKGAVARAVALLVVASSSACYRGAGDHAAATDGASEGASEGGSSDETGGGVQLACDETQRGLAETMHRRLSSPEILAALSQTFGAEVMGSDAVRQATSALPKDPPFDGSSEYDNRITDVEGLLAVAEAVAREAVARPAALGCDVASDATQCRDHVIETLSLELWRRPITDEERGELAAFVDELGAEWGIVRLIVSPPFHGLYELSGTPTDDGRVRVSAFEVATRLSFRLTGSAPDAELLQAALDGGLESTTDARLHAERLLDSPAARSQLHAVLGSWLQVQTVADPHPVVAAHHGLEPDGLGDEARDELFRFVDFVVYESDGTFGDLLTDKTAFAFSDRLAQLYAMEVSPDPQQFADSRGGILFRAATLMTNGLHTRPILRGAYVRRRILCGDLPSPDADVQDSRNDELEMLTHDEYSTREITTQLTRGGECMGCHGLINPVGFVQEEFGPMGELREREVVLDEGGEVIAEHPIDTRVDDLLLGDAKTPASGAADLAEIVAESDAARECFAKQLFAQTRLRSPTEQDECVLEELEHLLANDASIREVLVQNVVNDDLFLRHPFEGAP